MAHPPSFLATQVAMFMLRLSVGPQKNQPCGNYSGTFIGHESRWMRFLRRDFFFYVSTSTQVLDNFPATSTKFPTSTKVRHAEPFNQPTNKKTTAPLGGEPPWPTPGSHAFVRGICRGASDLGVAARAARRPSLVVSCRKAWHRGEIFMFVSKLITCEMIFVCCIYLQCV